MYTYILYIVDKTRAQCTGFASLYMIFCAVCECCGNRL